MRQLEWLVTLCTSRSRCSVDQLIDVIEGNRKYIRCLYVWNKVSTAHVKLFTWSACHSFPPTHPPQIDTVTMEDVDRLAREPNSVVVSCNVRLNLDRLVDRMWEALQLTRVYTKKRVSHVAAHASIPPLPHPTLTLLSRLTTLCRRASRQI